MSITSGDINLKRYQCAKCGQTPEVSTQLFTGCVCGHRLFRLNVQKKSTNLSSEKSPNDSGSKDMGFLTIRERKIGIYDINVEKLLDNKPKKDSTVVAGNNGVYSIRFQPPKKKRARYP
ncbi:MAG: hypothetical protein ACXAB2_02925 [Candidatus Hodarchaeales archaeon]|jgi:predicted  nucleic acid-binding Zn-ribbon protein